MEDVLHVRLFSIVCWCKVGLCLTSEKDIDVVRKIHLFHKYTKKKKTFSKIDKHIPVLFENLMWLYLFHALF